MNTRKLLLSLVILATVFSLSVVYAAGDAEESETERASGTSGNGLYEEKVTFELISRQTHHDNEAFVEDDAIVEYIEDRFNIDLIVNFVPSPNNLEVHEKLNILIASGNIPDIMQTDKNGPAIIGEVYRSMLEGGILLDTKAVVDQQPDRYPNLAERYQDEEALTLFQEPDGGIYTIPKMYGYWPHSWFVREDWLEELGIDPPQTLDEFVAMLRAFKENDPDGNNSVGLTAPGYFWLQHITAGFTGAFTYGVKDGDIVSVWEMPEHREAIRFLNMLYEEGLMDPEIFTHAPYRDDIAKFSTGRAGVIMLDTNRLALFENQLAEYRPDASVTILPPAIEGPNAVARITGSKYFEGASIYNESEDPERALDIIEYLIGDEGQELVRYGIEGVHYEMVDGERVKNEDVFAHEGWGVRGKSSLHRLRNIADLTHFFDLSQFNNPEMLRETLDQMEENIGQYAQSAMLGRNVESMTEYGGRMNTVIDKWSAMFITGAADIDDEWDDFLEELNDAGYEIVRQEINEKYEP